MLLVLPQEEERQQRRLEKQHLDKERQMKREAEERERQLQKETEDREKQVHMDTHGLIAYAATIYHSSYSCISPVQYVISLYTVHVL